MNNPLSNRLRIARENMEPKITQSDIAARFGVSKGSVSHWEKGTNEPRAAYLAELAQLYKVSADWLLGIDPPAIKSVSINVPINTVPVVSPTQLAQWDLSAPQGFVQVTAKTPGKTAAVKATNDSMAKVCPQGCFAIICDGIVPTKGLVVAVVLPSGGEPIIRQFVPNGSDTLLMPDDPRWPTVTLTPGCKILGVVVQVVCNNILVA